MAENGVPSILLVAQLSPPSPLVAARRVAGMTKYLARRGWSVTVLTSTISGEGAIEGADGVIRTHDLLSSPLNWRRGHFDALRGQVPAPYKPASKLESLVVPDLGLVTWLPFALSAALHHRRARSARCVVTTGPPQSTHLAGAVLRRRRGVPWIAELRDGWTFEPPRPRWPLAVQRALDQRLERRVLSRADAVVGVTEPIVDDLRTRLDLTAALVTNGFDPDEASPAAAPDDLLDPKRHSFVHTGRMAVGGASPKYLLQALQALRADAPAVARRLEVVLAGPLSRDEAELIAAADLDGLVRSVGPLERARAIALQRAADTLLVVTEGKIRRSVATGKLFEYLAARRPIIVLGEGTEAARIVTRTGSGIAVPADDPRAIAGALQRAAEGDWPTLGDGDEVSRYSWEALSAEYAALLEGVCSGAPF